MGKPHVFGHWLDRNGVRCNVPFSWEVEPTVFTFAKEVALKCLGLISIDGIVFGNRVKKLCAVPGMASGVVLWYQRGNIASYRLREHSNAIDPCVQFTKLARYGAWSDTSVMLF